MIVQFCNQRLNEDLFQLDLTLNLWQIIMKMCIAQQFLPDLLNLLFDMQKNPQNITLLPKMREKGFIR